MMLVKLVRRMLMKLNFTDWYATSWPGTDMSPKTSLVRLDVKHRPCGCNPDCKFYRYTVENSIGNLDSHIYYSGLQYTNMPRYSKHLTFYENVLESISRCLKPF